MKNEQYSSVSGKGGGGISVIDKELFGGHNTEENFRRFSMLFNSYVFIIGFLPITLILYYLSAKNSAASAPGAF